MILSFDNVLDLMFPSRCTGCGTRTDRGLALCAACERRVPIFSFLSCASCLARLPRNAKVCHPDTRYRLAAASDYRERTVRDLIHLLKFRGVRRAAAPLGRLLARHLTGLRIRLDTFTIVPLPLSRARERERGFNQASLIADTVAHELRLPLEPALLARARHTNPQSTLHSADLRRKNITGAFIVPAPERVLGERVLLVDDVRTSGATLDEAVRALKDAGAYRVIAAVVARA